MTLRMCEELGFPQKGWVLEDVIDLGERCYSTGEIMYESCEFCGNERIRYVHIISHSEYERYIRVGCNCAEKLTCDYVKPKIREATLRRKAGRKENFLKQRWKRTEKGNLTLKYKGKRLTIKCGKPVWSVVLNGKWINSYKGKCFSSFEIACLAAFDLFDSQTRADG